MRSPLYTFLSALFLLITIPIFSQQGSWPKVITTPSGTEIKVYEFQPQSLNADNLNLQAAVSIKEKATSEPVFGMLWADAITGQTTANKVSHFSNFVISTLKVPGVTEENDIEELKSILEREIPKFKLDISLNELNAKIDAMQKQTKLAGSINNNPPKIIYTKTPSILVFVDGQPQVQKNEAWGVDQVVNTPFTIIKNNDQRYYLYGNKNWFTATTVTGDWNYITRVPQRLAAIDEQVRKADTSIVTDHIIPEVIVSTVPAELIQSKGEPNFAPVQGTNLLYMTNTSNDIFHDIHSQHYYVLISGRWYRAPNLNSNWTYTAANNLPEDFVKIPEGSAKDAVLSSIAGTAAAEASVLDAQIPQTAKVDRNTATATVDYDGEPQFEQIEGTNMQYAVNTPGAVLHSGRRYYLVENGVWFESNDANGPWVVATERPDEVDHLPPSSPVYNVKYVYIYDATPEYVYMGYTPGYLGNYIYGPTIVYGTGYHYRPWRGRRYYARPVTYGFNMRYHPWSGWNFGFSIGSGWFYSELYDYNYFGQRVSYRSPCYGWWGASAYRPQYGRYYNNYYGRNVVINNNYIISNNRSNNVYRSRRDVVSNDRYESQRNDNYYHGREYQRNGRNRAGNYNNSGRSRYGTGQHPANVDQNNNSITQRPGRFGGLQQRNNDNGNRDESRNNSDQVNRLPVERQGRVYRPQQNAGNNNEHATSEHGNNRAGNVNNGVHYGRNRDESSRPATSNSNNPGIERNTRAATPEVHNERPDLSRPRRQDHSQPAVTRQQQPQQTGRNNGNQRVNTDMIRRSEAARQPDQPQRIYNPQRNMESPRTESRPAQQEIRRGNQDSHSSPEINRSNGGVISRPPAANRPEASENQGSERRIRRPGN